MLSSMRFAYDRVNTKRIQMTDTSVCMEDIASRLKLARERAGYAKASDAAEAMGVPRQTYYAHENGNRVPKHPDIEKYARRYKVSAEWLLTGKKHGVSEASISKAVEFLFKAIPPADLALMQPDDVAKITLTIARAVESGDTPEEITTNVVRMFAARM